MGIFSKRAQPDDPSEPVTAPVDAIENITLLATLRFRALGVQVEVDPQSSGHDTTLIAESGASYPLHNLFIHGAGLESGELVELVISHVDLALSIADLPSAADMSDDELRSVVRTRLMPRDSSFSENYAIPVAGDLVCMLCIDHPQIVSTLDDGQLEGRDIDDLFAAGLQHVMAEPVEDIHEVAPGITVFSGDSLFTASKVLGMSQLIADHLPPAPHGVFFGVPSRHLIFVLAPTSAESLGTSGIGTLGALVAGNARAEDALGGVVSPDIFVWRNGQIELAGIHDANGFLQMSAMGLTLELMEELAGQA